MDSGNGKAKILYETRCLRAPSLTNQCDFLQSKEPGIHNIYILQMKKKLLLKVLFMFFIINNFAFKMDFKLIFLFISCSVYVLDLNATNFVGTIILNFVT